MLEQPQGTLESFMKMHLKQAKGGWQCPAPCGVTASSASRVNVAPLCQLLPRCQSRRFVVLQSQVGIHLRQNVTKIYKQYAMFYTSLSAVSLNRGRVHDQGMH